MIVKNLISNIKNFLWEGISNKTIHYKLIFSFLEDRSIEVLETNSKTKTTKRVMPLNYNFCHFYFE